MDQEPGPDLAKSLSDEASARLGNLGEKSVQTRLHKLEAALHIIADVVEAIYPPLQVKYYGCRNALLSIVSNLVSHN